MADVQFGGDAYPHYDNFDADIDEGSATHPGRWGTIASAFGALVSVALVIGMGVWAWNLLMRDVTDVPVIEAMEGAMRIAPEDPGGAVAENQGLAVNRLAEGAEAAPVPDQIVLAPPPIDLTPVAPTPREQAFDNGSVAEAPVTPEEVADDTAALIDRLLAEAQPLAPLENDASPADNGPVTEVAAASIIPESVPGVPRSPRPLLRPATLVISGNSTGDSPAASPNASEIAADTLTAGTRLVQLGAYDTADLAREDWQRLATQFPDYLAGRARVVEQATSGGETFFRLRAHGFDDLSASRRFCTALIARGAACIPVTVR